jgi:hypothetical protein
MSAPQSARQILDKATSEDALLTAITDALTALGWTWSHHRRSDRGLLMGHRGLPDVIAVRRGEVRFLELKAERENLTEDQWRWAREITSVPSARIRFDLYRPSDLDRAIEELR